MKERPILFSAPMVRAILAGQKTQTRRVITHRWEWQIDEREDDSLWPSHPDYVTGEPKITWLRCPYGVVGDRLWVKETHQYADWTEDGMPWLRYAADGATRFFDSSAIPESWGEKLTDIWADLSLGVTTGEKAADRKWRPSIFMPRWASRITLEITEVRVQRLQDINVGDAWDEGIPMSPDVNPVHEYSDLWESINGAGSWDANPWIWALTFRRVP